MQTSINAYKHLSARGVNDLSSQLEIVAQK